MLFYGYVDQNVFLALFVTMSKVMLGFFIPQHQNIVDALDLIHYVIAVLT